MKKINLVIILLLLTSLAFAQKNADITATVIKFKGTVLYNGIQITQKTLFSENGTIEVKKNSYLKIKVEQYNSTMAISPNSTLRLKFSKKVSKSPYILMNGLLRWVTQGESKRKGFVHTKKAIFGVRGTDFLISVNSLLDESEIYCFDGKVIVVSRKDNKSRAFVKKNDWAGIGGRFSEKVGNIIPMTEEQISHVKGLLE